MITTTATPAAATVVLIPCLLGSMILKAVPKVSIQHPCFIDEGTESGRITCLRLPGYQGTAHRNERRTIGCEVYMML